MIAPAAACTGLDCVHDVVRILRILPAAALPAIEYAPSCLAVHIWHSLGLCQMYARLTDTRVHW